MLRNQASALLEHERIQTTVPKAKELRPFVERIISIAKRSLDAPAGSSRAVTARRRVAADIANREVVSKLFETIAPRFAARPGGYTRLMRTGYRKGDSAELAMVELIGSEFDPNAKTEAPAEEAKPKSKGVGGRLRAAAERLRGTKKGDDDSRKVTAKPTKGAGAGRRSTTPRKAGGS